MKSYYDNLILDVDGVLLDSNTLKEKNIRKAAKPFADRKLLDEFIEYFVSLNGVPREVKIEHFFGPGSEISQMILSEYNQLNEQQLHDVPLTEGVLDFLPIWSGVCPVYALSGGTQREVQDVLESKGLSNHFTEILGGPVTKSRHLKKLSLTGAILYVGDSLHDAEIAEQFGFDFLFMHRYSQFGGWGDYFSLRPHVTVIADLTHWPVDLQPSVK